LEVAVVFLLFSVVFSNAFISPIKVASLEEEVIRVDGFPLEVSEENSFYNTTYAYSQTIQVDGADIAEKKVENSESSNVLALVDNGNFLVVNSPSLSSYSSVLSATDSLSDRQGITTYTVQKGDTLGGIATKFDVSLSTLLSANNLSSKTLIQPGQELTVLPVSGMSYTVKKGDTLLRIAETYHSSVDQIVVFNNLKDAASIRTGQVIIIPGGYSSGSTVKSSALPEGLTPNTSQEQGSIESWSYLSDYFIFPTIASAQNKGILHHLNAVDITAPCGSPIYAAAAGFVYGVQMNERWYGNNIAIQHDNGTITVYAHLSQILVKEGGKVKQGDLIGSMGDTGNTNGCHLHFEVHGAKNPFVK